MTPTSRAELSTCFPVIPLAALALLVLDHQRHRYKTREGELLDPSILGLQRRHLRRVQIAFRIDGQMVQRTELSLSRAPRSKSIEELERLAVENHDLRLASIRHVEIALLGVWGEREAGRGLPVAAIRGVAFTSNEHLVDEFTGDREYLNASSATIGDVHKAVG